MAEISFSGEPSKRKLLPLEKAKSAVWNYFGFPAQGGEFIEKDKKRTTVFCKLCPKQLPYNSSTTNVMVHLQYNHLSEFKKAKEKSDAVVPTAQRSKEQPTVAEAFQYLEPLSRSAEMEEPNELCLLLHCKRHDALQHNQQRRISKDAAHF